MELNKFLYFAEFNLKLPYIGEGRSQDRGTGKVAQRWWIGFLIVCGTQISHETLISHEEIFVGN